jgi:Raf kinase inhibitor-like YbhB/YbcL family protein
MKRTYISFILALLVITFAATSSCKKEQSLSLESDAFLNNSTIPAEFTCDGADISPALTWSNSPEETKSFALICDDPNAPGVTFTHWIVYNIPTSIKDLDKNMPIQLVLNSGASQGKNDFGEIGYSGPCPPRSITHHYYFKLYALDSMLDISAGVTKIQLVSAMRGHILGSAELIGIYSR